MSEPEPNIDEIFLAALEKETPEERAEYLDQVCGDNAELRQRVERLLEAHPKAENFMERPAANIEPTLPFPEIAERPGMVIGRYKLLHEMGKGGFGIVFMAEQQEPVTRRVALKVIKPGMDTKEVVARFESERQALAMMDHPNIAKVYDAGATDSGRPFFVMELVKGIPITEYCEQNNLSVKERLELFVSVSQAIHHAHQKGIIHRDLKPSNILTTLQHGTPVVKVIDFGVAKAISQKLTARTLATDPGRIIGTPLYMSPEQAEMSALDVDTRTDIYSLGVLLYELLTGATPFDKQRLREAAYDEIRRIIREEEPQKPSTKISTIGETATEVAQHRKTEPKKLSALLQGDLDWIVMKSLEKDRTRRYETAKDFADDVIRHMDHKPVEAGPPSTAYRVSKFVKRHKAVVAVAMTIVASLLLGLLGLSAGLSYAIHAWEDAKENEIKAIAAQKAEGAERKKAQKNERAAIDARKAAVRQSALANLQAAQSLCEQGKIYEGVLKFTQGLPIAQSAHADDLEEVYRFSLDAWSREVHQLMQVLEHPGRVNCVKVSCDGKWLATACNDGKVRIWDLVGDSFHALEEPQMVLPYPEATDRESQDAHRSVRVTSIAFDPQGGSILAGYTDGSVRVWDLASQEILKEITDIVSDDLEINWRWPHSKGISAVAFGPEGRRFVTAGYDGHAHVWDANTYEQVIEPIKHSHWITDIAVCSHGKHLATVGYEHTLAIWSMETGAQVAKCSTGNMCFAVDMDCRRGRVVVGTLQDQTARQLRLERKRIITSPVDPCPFAANGSADFEIEQTFDHAGQLTCTRYSPDGTQLLTTSTATSAHLWDAETGDQIGTVMRHPSSLTAGCFAPDGRTLFTGCDDGGVRVWRIARTNCIHVLRHDGQVGDIAFSRDGAKLVTSIIRRLKPCYPFLWETSTGRRVVNPALPALNWTLDVQYAPDNRTIFVGEIYWPERVRNEMVTWFDAETGEKEGSLPVGEKEREGPGRAEGGFKTAWHILLSQDSTKLVAGLNRAHVWDVSLGKPTKVKPTAVDVDHKGNASAMAITSDNRTLITGGPEENIQLWDLESGKRLNSFSVGTEVTTLAVRNLRHEPHTFRLLVGGSVGEIQAFDYDGDSLKPVGPPMNQMERINAAVFARNGVLIVSCSDDYSARIWHESGSPIGPLLRHDKRVSAIDTNDRKGLIATGSYDKTAKIWHLPSPMNGEIDWIRLYATSFTGMDIDASGMIRVLDAREWCDRFRTPLGRDIMGERARSERDDAISWHRERAATMSAAERWGDAVHHLDRLLEQTPEDVHALITRAGICFRLRQYQRAVDDYERVIALTATLSPDAWHSLGHCYEKLDGLAKAIAAFDECLKAQPREERHARCRYRILTKAAAAGIALAKGANTDTVNDWALLQLNVGKMDEYLATCERLVDRVGKEVGPETLIASARTLALAPGAAEQAKRFLDITRDKLATDQFEYQVALGALLYRTKQLDRAVETLLKALSRREETEEPQTQPLEYAWLFLAMAEHERGNTSESKLWLQKAVEGIKEMGQGDASVVAWNMKLALQLLQDESKLISGANE